MTGIERLVDIVNDGPYSGGMIHISVQKLREICEQIEHEVADISGHESDVLAFVEEKGGLDELERRLMPEGMEWLLEVWPKWSNGEYCKFGDWWTAKRYGDYEPKKLLRLVIYTPEQLSEWEQGDGESYGYEWDFMRPSEVGYRPDKADQPSPPVLASDGKPLEVGQTVWDVNTGDEFEVCELIQDDVVEVVVEYMNCGVAVHGRVNPETLTHQRPVLDANGVPIELGDDLYSVEGSLKLHVSNIDRANCRIATSAMFALDKWADPSMFTHTKPEPSDSWEKVEKDADLKPRGYVDLVLGWDMSKNHSENQARWAMTHDLVRRCRALAGVSQ